MQDETFGVTNHSFVTLRSVSLNDKGSHATSVRHHEKASFYFIKISLFVISSDCWNPERLCHSNKKMGIHYLLAISTKVGIQKAKKKYGFPIDTLGNDGCVAFGDDEIPLDFQIIGFRNYRETWQINSINIIKNNI